MRCWKLRCCRDRSSWIDLQAVGRQEHRRHCKCLWLVCNVTKAQLHAFSRPGSRPCSSRSLHQVSSTAGTFQSGALLERAMLLLPECSFGLVAFSGLAAHQSAALMVSPNSARRTSITRCRGCVRSISVLVLRFLQVASVMAADPYAPPVRQHMPPGMPPQQGPPLQGRSSGDARGSSPGRGGRGSGRRDPRQRR